MLRRVPFREEFSHVREITTEVRLVTSVVDGVRVIEEIEFDSSSLDPGTYEMYSLENMLSAGVKPGVARFHDSNFVDTAEAANAVAESVMSNVKIKE